MSKRGGIRTLEANDEKCNNPNHHQADEQLGVGTPTWGCVGGGTLSIQSISGMLYILPLVLENSAVSVGIPEEILSIIPAGATGCH